MAAAGRLFVLRRVVFCGITQGIRIFNRADVLDYRDGRVVETADLADQSGEQRPRDGR